MFEKPQRKLINIKQSLATGQKYVSKFDSLSIAVIDIDENNNFSADLPRMEGMRTLANDINNILSEAYIEQQQPLIDFKNSVVECQKLAEEIMTELKPFADKKQQVSVVDPKLFLDSIKGSSNINHSTHGRTLETQLRPKLIDIYETISSIIDTKFSMLEQIQEITAFYIGTVVSVASASSVLRAEDKVNYLVNPHFSPLLSHKLFNSHEVRYL